MRDLDTQLIFEQYKKIYKELNINSENLKDLYEHDIQCIEELLQESGLVDEYGVLNEGFFSNISKSLKSASEKLGTFKSNVNSNIRGAVKTTKDSVKNAVTNAASSIGDKVQKGISGLKSSIATNLVKLLTDTTGNLQKIVELIKSAGEGKFKIDLNNPEAKQIIDYLKGSSPKKESYIDNKQFLAHLLFTEENLREAFRNDEVILEATKSNTQTIDQLAKEVADKIQQLYPKNKKALANALTKFNTSFSNYSSNLGSGTAANTAKTSKSGGKVPKNVSVNTNQVNQNLQKSGVSTSGGSIPKGPGLIQKLYGFIREHPKISAVGGVVILGILVSAFAGSAPVIVPTLLAAVKGAGIGGAINVGKQMWQNKSMDMSKIDLKQAGKGAAVGAAFGGVGKILSIGLSNIASSFTSIFSGSKGGGSETSELDSAAINKMGWDQRQNAYWKEIMDTAKVNNADFRMGIPLDENGNQLLSDEQIDKIAKKYNYPAATKSYIKANQYDPNNSPFGL